MKTAAIAIIFSEKRDEILLIKRRDTPIWVLPGGGIDTGETPQDAVVREVKEETGLQCCVVREVGYYFPTNKLSGKVHTFICKVTGGKVVPCPHEVLEVGFYPLHRLPSPLFPPHRSWITDGSRDTRESIERIEAPVPGVSYTRLLLFCLRHPWIAFWYGLRWEFWSRFFKKN